MIIRLVLAAVFLLPILSGIAQQPGPTVEIILSTTEAQIGDTIYADVVIRNGEAMAGADIGITTDGECLRIIGHQPGDYLPTTSEAGGFIVFEELTDSDTRLAVAILDRTKVAYGDGVFFRATLEVTCESGSSNITVSFAEMAALADPEGTSNELAGFNLDTNTVTITSDMVSIAPDAIASTAIPLEQASAAHTQEGSTPGLNLLVIFGAAALLIVVLVGFSVVRSRRKQAGTKAA